MSTPSRGFRALPSLAEVVMLAIAALLPCAPASAEITLASDLPLAR